MRTRVASQIYSLKDSGLWTFLKGELGVEIPYSGFGPDWSQFTAKADLKDLLDAITLVYGRLKLEDKHAAYKRDVSWLREIRRILKEENVGYVVDDFRWSRTRSSAVTPWRSANRSAASSARPFSTAASSIQTAMIGVMVDD